MKLGGGVAGEHERNWMRVEMNVFTACTYKILKGIEEFKIQKVE